MKHQLNARIVRTLGSIVLAVLLVFSMAGCDPNTGDADTIINIAAIGVTAPVTGATPVTTVTANDQYIGTVAWNPNDETFAGSTTYTATITLAAKEGYTLQGVDANFFTVAGATLASNNANSGVITAIFPQTAETAPTTITTRAISGVTAPVIGATPVTATSTATQFSGTVIWSGELDGNGKFKAHTEYTATITLTPRSNYTLEGVEADFFTVSGATATNAANSGIVTAVFPPITPITITTQAISGVTRPSIGATPVTTTSTLATQFSGTVTWEGELDGNGKFKDTVYTATITLTPRGNYTLEGVEANFFTVAGATATNAANSGVITAVFTPTTITTQEIGIARPSIGLTPGKTTWSTQFSGTVTWEGELDGNGKFKDTVYTATITLTPGTGYTLQGVEANFFTVAGATATNAANSGVITTVFIPTIVSTQAIRGVTAPILIGATPVTAITLAAQFSGTVTWEGELDGDGKFKTDTIYTATITLTPVTGYTLQGVGANFFTVAGATATNAANSGVITAVFLTTGILPNQSDFYGTWKTVSDSGASYTIEIDETNFNFHAVNSGNYDTFFTITDWERFVNTSTSATVGRTNYTYGYKLTGTVTSAGSSVSTSSAGTRTTTYVYIHRDGQSIVSGVFQSSAGSSAANYVYVKQE